MLARLQPLLWVTHHELSELPSTDMHPGMTHSCTGQLDEGFAPYRTIFPQEQVWAKGEGETKHHGSSGTPLSSFNEIKVFSAAEKNGTKAVSQQAMRCKELIGGPCRTRSRLSIVLDSDDWEPCSHFDPSMILVVDIPVVHSSVVLDSFVSKYDIHILLALLPLY